MARAWFLFMSKSFVSTFARLNYEKWLLGCPLMSVLFTQNSEILQVMRPLGAGSVVHIEARLGGWQQPARIALSLIDSKRSRFENGTELVVC
jgi:hypothetical protein